MKNRDKFRKAIVKYAKTPEMKADVCEFIKLNVLPHFGKEDCDDINEDWCPILFDLWLDEEYIEPEVDWDSVPVDTLVRVRDLESEEWTLKYFKGIDEEASASRFMVWDNGATSKTAYGNYTHWVRCELVEDEDDDK